ncbi:uncharacterized protein V6R79_001266 [Siganus canaliculatus]
MASLGQIIYVSMITLIVLFSTLIILILALAFGGSGMSDVTSINTMPIANLGEDKLLSCYLQQSNIHQIAVTWVKEGLNGLVYHYEQGAPDLADQNSQFKGRTQLFPDAVVAGNASLLLRNVRRNDGGEYTCSISSADGGGDITIHLRTAAFSAPTFALSNRILTAEANRWLPKPNVTWSDLDGNVLQGNTNFTASSGGIFSVVSTLQPVNASGTYICRIENDLVTASSKATITGSEVSGNTYFTFSTASSLQASTQLSIMTGMLCIYYLI